jgi:hypothetical protein
MRAFDQSRLLAVIKSSLMRRVLFCTYSCANNDLYDCDCLNNSRKSTWRMTDSVFLSIWNRKCRQFSSAWDISLPPSHQNQMWPVSAYQIGRLAAPLYAEGAPSSMLLPAIHGRNESLCVATLVARIFAASRSAILHYRSSRRKLPPQRSPFLGGHTYADIWLRIGCSVARRLPVACGTIRGTWRGSSCRAH